MCLVTAATEAIGLDSCFSELYLFYWIYIYMKSQQAEQLLQFHPTIAWSFSRRPWLVALSLSAKQAPKLHLHEPIALSAPTGCFQEVSPVVFGEAHSVTINRFTEKARSNVVFVPP